MIFAIYLCPSGEFTVGSGARDGRDTPFQADPEPTRPSPKPEVFTPYGRVLRPSLALDAIECKMKSLMIDETTVTQLVDQEHHN